MTEITVDGKLVAKSLASFGTCYLSYLRRGQTIEIYFHGQLTRSKRVIVDSMYEIGMDAYGSFYIDNREPNIIVKDNKINRLIYAELIEEEYEGYLTVYDKNSLT